MLGRVGMWWTMFICRFNQWSLDSHTLTLADCGECMHHSILLRGQFRNEIDWVKNIADDSMPIQFGQKHEGHWFLMLQNWAHTFFCRWRARRRASNHCILATRLPIESRRTRWTSLSSRPSKMTGFNGQSSVAARLTTCQHVTRQHKCGAHRNSL